LKAFFLSKIVQVNEELLYKQSAWVKQGRKVIGDLFS
jgi:hypothetical protein